MCIRDSFETAYYQALEYCISEGIQTFEGGAQGEHKMARGFLPKTLQSAHWLANAQFSQAVKHYLARERAGMAAYVDELAEHSPLKSNTVLPWATITTSKMRTTVPIPFQPGMRSLTHPVLVYALPSTMKFAKAAAGL